MAATKTKTRAKTAPKTAAPKKEAPKMEAPKMEAFEEAFAFSSQAWKDGFEKTLSSYDDLTASTKENMDALVESATVSQKGMEAINAEAISYTQKAMEDGAAAAKAAFSAKNVQELIELNTEYTKSAFDAYIAATTKIGEMFATTAKEASEPLNARMTATIEAATAQ